MEQLINNEDPDSVLSPMGLPEKARLNQTAARAQKVYPGIVGKILADFIDSWVEFGYRLGMTADMTLLHKHIWAMPLPDDDVKPSDQWVEIV